MRLFIADSDADLLARAERFFAQCGHELRTAQNGVECVATLRQFSPEVVALDTELQWGGAEGVIAWMRDQPGLEQVPLIWLGVRRVSHMTPAHVGLRVVGRLVKPFRLSELLTLIEADRRTITFPQSAARDATGGLSPVEESCSPSDILS